jgi:hypothetical protein
MNNTQYFQPLSAAEEQLKKACDSGVWSLIGHKRPLVKTLQNTVKAEFIRFLALGGDEESSVHHRGVHLEGAWIVGKLDLMNATVNCSIILKNCHLEETPSFLHSNITGLLSLRGSLVPGIDARGLRIRNSVTLDKGFLSTGSLLFIAAEIEGDLDLDGAQINHSASNFSLNAEDIYIHKNCRMGPSFFSNGEIRLIGAKIGADFDCSDGQFMSRDSKLENQALTCDGIVIAGSLFLSENFISKGAVSFPAASIQKGIYVNANHPISLIDLSNSETGYLVDKLSAWGESAVLAGFTYKSIRKSDCTAAARLKWLKQQSINDFGVLENKHDFRPQPWLHVIKILRDMGHAAEANRVAIEYQKHLWKIRKINGSAKRVAHYLYGFSTGYGYRPFLLIRSWLLVWVFFGAVYWFAALNGVFAPSNPLIFENPIYTTCRPVVSPEDGTFDSVAAAKANSVKNWYTCSILKGEYTTFSPLAYSLDLALPLIDLQQEKDWAPFVNTGLNTAHAEFFHFSLNHFVRFATWIEILLGWILSLLLVAQLSGLTRIQSE